MLISHRTRRHASRSSDPTLSGLAIPRRGLWAIAIARSRSSESSDLFRFLSFADSPIDKMKRFKFLSIPDGRLAAHSSPFAN
jgi:hypothetical protein